MREYLPFAKTLLCDLAVRRTLQLHRRLSQVILNIKKGFGMSRPDQSLELAGKLLIAMPGMMDPRFDGSVIYMCSHSSEGAMGLVINRPIEHASFKELCSQLSIETTNARSIPVLFGGPVDQSRGFVVHSQDYQAEVSTQPIGQTLSMTATKDIIEAVATGSAPEQASLFMGYSGWGAGQIEDEIANNGWLVSDANEDMVLSVDHGGKWQSALGLMGIDALMLSSYGGTA
tara:strand:+ start:130 stop:819 length:690 start_codon:yes stop_codon:yes gene_type:complete